MGICIQSCAIVLSVIEVLRLFYRDAVDDLALHFLAKMKILVVKDIEREDIEFVCKVYQYQYTEKGSYLSVFWLLINLLYSSQIWLSFSEKYRSRAFFSNFKLQLQTDAKCFINDLISPPFKDSFLVVLHISVTFGGTLFDIYAIDESRSLSSILFIWQWIGNMHSTILIIVEHYHIWYGFNFGQF